MTCLVWSLACYLHTRKWTLASCNIESDNVDDLEIRPVKKAKCSISSEFESDKQKNECDPSLLPTSPKEDSYSVESTDFESDKQMNEGDPSLLPPSPKANSYKVESSDFELDKQMNEGDPSLLPPSPKADSYSVESSGFESDKLNDKRLLLDDFLQPEEHEKSKVDETYDHLPEDYEMTDLDCCAQIAIESASATDIRVKIDDIFVTQEQLLCLLDPEIFLNDDVISAYICCIKDQARQLDRNDVKFYFENPFISMVLKGAGNLGMNKDSNYITNIVRDYLKHEMVLIPINIKSTHWYLAIINTQKCEIQVLDSLCWNFNRADLTATLQGIQYHLDIIKKHDHHVSHNWKNLQITKWTITEALQEPLQKDGYSCGLFLLKFMEYWTGDTLSHRITQESIDNFRYKLAGILLCWKTNTAGMANNFGQNDGTEADCNDVTILESPNGQKECQTLDSLSAEMKYGSLMSVLSKMSVQELVGGLCDYVKSINCTETLDKVWVRNSKPYSISLTLKTLQEILKEDQPMDRDCFNLVVRNFMSNDNQVVKKNKGTISKHYLDLRFWMITDFGRHPNFRKKLDMEKLADSVGSWPGINYCVSRCKLILMPIESHGTFILVILNKDNRTVYILDPTRLDPIYKYNPNAKYVKKLLWIAEYLSKAMSKAYPGSKWNEDVFLWRQIILSDVPTQSRELSGFLVSLFMCSWKNEELRLPILKDGYELRRQLLAQLLMCKENECEDNMPSGVRDFLSCINTDEIWK